MPSKKLEEPLWELTDKPYGTADEDDPKSGSVQFRIQGQWLGLATELREDVEGEFYRIYPSPSAMYRDILIKGLLAMAEYNKNTRSRARELRLREASLNRLVHNKSRRHRVEELVEPLIKSMREDVEADDVDSAVDLLDHYLSEVAKMDEGEDGRGAYAKGLLSHPEFKRLRNHRGVRNKSGLLGAFEQEYGGEV